MFIVHVQRNFEYYFKLHSFMSITIFLIFDIQCTQYMYNYYNIIYIMTYYYFSI